jgi:hypothetical protein
MTANRHLTTWTGFTNEPKLAPKRIRDVGGSFGPSGNPGRPSVQARARSKTLAQLRANRRRPRAGAQKCGPRDWMRRIAPWQSRTWIHRENCAREANLASATISLGGSSFRSITKIARAKPIWPLSVDRCRFIVRRGCSGRRGGCDHLRIR